MSSDFWRGWWSIRATAFLSGVAISIGATVYVILGGVLGAVLFSFGLLATVYYGWFLYTGTSGFINLTSIEDWWDLLGILIYNVVGCGVMSLAIQYVHPELIPRALEIVNTRLGYSLWECFVLAILCGFIMTTVVKIAREKNQWIVLLFGVPIFILCGFLHSIADAFYIMLSNTNNVEILHRWYMVILGNFVGCNAIRLIRFQKQS